MNGVNCTAIKICSWCTALRLLHPTVGCLWGAMWFAPFSPRGRRVGDEGESQPYVRGARRCACCTLRWDVCGGRCGLLPSPLAGEGLGMRGPVIGVNETREGGQCLPLSLAQLTPSDIHLGTQLDNPVGRDLELIRRPQGVALQQHKELAAQIEIPGAVFHDERLVGHKERGLHHPAA